MKRKNIIIISVISILVVALIWIYKKPISTNNYTSAVIVDTSQGINKKIESEDLEALKKIFDGKRTFNDNPACGFSDDEALIFNDKYIFEFAHDGDYVIKYKNNGKYIDISEKEREQLEKILEKYGYHFSEL